MKAKTLNAVAAVIGVFCSFFTTSAFAAAKHVTLSCSGYTGTTTLTNFQALVKLTEGVGGFSYSDCAANGTDLWFTDASGTTVYPHEVDTWNTSGESFVWVRLPEVLPTSGGLRTTFAMHWGDLATKQTTSENAWKNYNDGKGGFAGVWHMNSAGGTATEPDSTDNGLTGTPQGANPATAMTNAVGVVGVSRANRATDSALLIPAYSSTLTSPANFTISGWWNLAAWDTYPRFFQQADTKWQVSLWNSFGDTYIQGVVSGGVSTGWNNSTKKNAPRTASFVNTWMYLTVVFNGTTMEIYSNGAKRWTKTDATANEAYEGGFRIGNSSTLTRPWYGYYDEVRMYDGVQTADRIKADYDTMNTPDSFLTFVEARETTLRATGYVGTTTLTNFQTLVKISESAGGFSYSQCAANYGDDLWFTDSAGNVIPHEVDTWNTSGDSFVWVRLPELSPVAQGVTSFTMHWGDAVEKAAHSCTTTNTWSGLLGVWHMNGIVENGVPQTETDASGNGLDATPVGYNNNTTDIRQMGRAATAVVGHARVNKNVTNANNTNGLKVPKYTGKLTDDQEYALGGWFRRTGNGNGTSDYLRLFANGGTFTLSGGNDPANSGGNIDVFRNATASPIVFNSFATSNSDWSWPSDWVYLVFVSDGTTQFIYKDGRLLKSVGDAAATVHINDYGFTIGGKGWRKGNSLNGEYDEVRFYNGAISADRVKADYDTMSTPDKFVTYTTIATWTGAANDGDGANPLNWECSDSGVVVGGQLPSATYRIQSCTLSRDCDWSGLGTAYLADGAVIEMDGHSLTLPAVSGSGTVQNSASGDAKELTLALATNWTNSDTAFVGNLKLVKTEAGVLTSSIAQLYSGGTEVRRGTIQAPQSTAAYNASFTPFGTGTITVNSNAVFNAQSTVAYRNNVILNGGTIRGGAGSGTDNQRPIVMLERVTEDSSINQAVKAIEIGVAGTTTDLNGHTVTVSIANDTYFRWYGSLEGVTGKIVTSGAGFFEDMPDEARGIDFDVASAINFSHAVHVRNFRAANPDPRYGSGTGYGMHVHGTYIPVGNYYYGCIMEDGSMLDLSARTGYFSQTSVLSNPSGMTAALQNARKSVQFPDNGTVTVNLAGRTDLKTIAESESNYIVKWNSYYGQPTTTTFRLDAETAQKFKLKSDATGLRLNKKKGLVILVK